MVNDSDPTTKWKLKACPHCGRGDLYSEKDVHGDIWERCLQCGYEHALKHGNVAKTLPLVLDMALW